MIPALVLKSLSHAERHTFKEISGCESIIPPDNAHFNNRRRRINCPIVCFFICPTFNVTIDQISIMELLSDPFSFIILMIQRV